MWITIIALSAVAGIAGWYAWPRVRGWINRPEPSMPNEIKARELIGPIPSGLHRHRSTDADIENHASTLIARLEAELRLAAERDRMDREIAMLDGIR